MHELDRQADSPVNKAMASVAKQVWQAEAVEPPPLDDEDARKRVYAQIISREGQPNFRRALVEAYSCRCVVTGCDAIFALEAAHIRPYRGPAWNVVSNGLLLRADIHTLFDRDLLGIDPQTRRVVLASQLSGTHYQTFSGVAIAEPLEEWQRPSQGALNERWEQFQKE